MLKPSETIQGFSENTLKLEAVDFSSSLGELAKLHTELTRRGPDGHFVGGLVHQTVRGPGGKVLGSVVHIANPYETEPIDIVTLPTRCTKAEIEQIRSNIIPMRETYEILLGIAKAYEQRHAILIEGDTSIGKTFIVNRFMELLYGKGARPVDFYCSGQTDVSELLGKWAPKTSGLSENDKRQLDEFLQSSYGQSKLAAIQAETANTDTLPSEMQRSIARNKLSEMLGEIGLSGGVQWEFSYGAVPKAMTSNVGKDGKLVAAPLNGAGTILKVDEVGLAEPAVVMALLRIRGEGGKLTDQIQLWEAGGETIKAGPDFFVIYTTNPSDKDYVERKEIDPALARSVIWIRKGSLCEESLNLAAKKYFRFEVGNDPGTKPLRCVIDLRREPELSQELAEIAAQVHQRYLEQMKHGEVGRRQKLPGSLDHLARLAGYLLSNQVVDPKSGSIDFGETMKRGIQFIYLSGLIEKKITGTIEKELGMLLSDSGIGIKKFRGSDMSRKQILELLTKEAQVNLTKTKTVQSKASGSEQQIFGDILDSILSQLTVRSLPLVEKIVPQVASALEMFADESTKEQLIEALATHQRPSIRTDAEWEDFKRELSNLHLTSTPQAGVR